MEEHIVVSDYERHAYWLFSHFCNGLRNHIVKVDKRKRIVTTKTASFRFVSRYAWEHNVMRGCRAYVVNGNQLSKLLDDFYDDFKEGVDYETFINKLSELRCGPG